MRVAERVPVIEEVLDAWSPALGSARAAYRGHVYRVYNFARRVYGSARRDEVFAVASVFHDLGIWSDRTFDYLAPSSARARDFIRESAVELPAELVTRMIGNHHCLRRIRHGTDPAAEEALRRADFVDLSFGVLRAGLPRSFVREVVGTFPREGFHRILLAEALRWLPSHPLRPLPMLRFSETRETRESVAERPKA